MKQIWLVLAIVTTGIFGSTSIALSQSENPSRAELEAKYDRLFQQMFADPTNLDLTFQFAAVATQIENYESAISALERMLLLNPDLPRVKLELGVLYFRLGAYPIARSYFLDAIAAGDAPGLVIQRVNAYLEEVDKRLSRHHFTGSIRAGFRGQSNANAGPASNLVRVLGIDGTIDDEFAMAPDGNFFAGGNVTHFYDLRAGMLDSWQTDGAAFGTHQFNFVDLNLGFGEIRSGPLFVLEPDLSDRLTVRPFVSANVLTLGQEQHFYSYGGGLEAAKVFDTRTSVNGSFEYRHQEYQSSSSRPFNDELSNDGYVIRVTGQHYLTDNVRAGFYVTMVDEDARMVFNSNREYLAAGFVGVQYAPPMGLTNWPWQLDLSVLGVITDYEAPDPQVDPNVIREDREWRVNIVNTIGFSREWSAYVQFGYSNNQSNLPNFTFDNITGVVGVTRSFF